MIGAPDVVAFTKEDDFGEVGYPNPGWCQKSSLSLCSHRITTPTPGPRRHTPSSLRTSSSYQSSLSRGNWGRGVCVDLTVCMSGRGVCVGPQPLLTIPDDPKVFGTFDLNYFSLRIMSVDYQASFVGHPTGSGYPRLSFVEDSRVVLGNSKEGAFD
ncbi:unnamed protein product [Oncorhynchus mykiss]|uniref:UDENN FLCN/SMCR8-type domain-containing protein n=1 Tax=Oncorhynchus mykiss TaxID=8022 RepID=A0A060Z462_ONCMY|nr:unnamed protein product [Oncorhynchus mykiss]